MEIKSLLRRNLKWVVCGLFGILNFILMAIPYMAFCSYGGNIWSDNYAATLRATRDGVSAYDLFNLGKALRGTDAAAAGGAAGAFSAFALITGILMILICAAGILKDRGVISFPDKLGRMKTDFIVDTAFFALIGFNLLVMICISAVHGISLSEIEVGKNIFTVGYSISAGVFITLIFASGAYAAMRILDKKLPADPGIVTICTACGKRCARSAKFCTLCGAPTEERKEHETVFVCEKCGKRVRFKDKYCPECGSKIVVKRSVASENAAEPSVPPTEAAAGSAEEPMITEVPETKTGNKAAVPGKKEEKQTQEKSEAADVVKSERSGESDGDKE